MRELIEERQELHEELLMEEDAEYAKAMAFLKKGILPGGGKWKVVPKLKIGFDGEITVSSVKKKKKGDSTEFTFGLKLMPGKGGGGGVGIDPAASNQYFNEAGTDSSPVNGMKKAFLSAAKGSMQTVNAQMTKWFRNRDNWVWRVVGYPDRNMWIPDDKSLKFLKTKIKNPMVDPARRKWPAGRTEIWAPLDMQVKVVMKGKK
jgi:hypothetical protein